MSITRFRIPFIQIQNLTPMLLYFQIVNEKNGTRKYNIYIPYINRIKINEGVSNPIGKPLGCIGALGV